MPRFNTTAPSTLTINEAGGKAYKQSDELELVSILLTSFGGNEYYKSSNDTFKRLKELVNSCETEFVSKAIIYARTQFGMRTITHVAASELALKLSGKKYAKNFFDKVIYRVDDITEIISYHFSKGGKLSGAMKKGFASAIGRFDEYSLAKYRGEGKGVRLVDVVNMVHPKQTEKNQGGIEKLIKGELKSFDTWEVDITAAGSDEVKKKAAWSKLVTENKLGYFALLRNLRNLLQYTPELTGEVVSQLTDEKSIAKSLVLPFRFITAFDEIQKMNASKEAREVLMALNKAVDISIKNVPIFDGDTLVVLDVSSSMSGKPSTIGALFASVLIKSNNADLILFATGAEYRNVNPMDSTITIANQFRFSGGGTNFPSIFQVANKKYDRVIILSDMQGWIGRDTPVSTYNQYKQRTGANPFVYSFDLNSYGSMMFPENNVFCIAGFSEKVFDIMALLERDKKALINTINAIEL